MSENRANLTQARGLVTFGSELTKPQGSQKKAVNVNIDEDGVITPRRGLNNYLNPTENAEVSSKVVSQIMEYKDAIIRKYQDTIEYEDVSTGEFKAVNGEYASLREGYRTKWKEVNSNLYFTSDEGIKKMSVSSPSDLNPDMITNSGGVKAGYIEGKIVPFIGGFLAPESKVAYRYLFGEKDNSGNLIYGSPSSRTVITNFDKETTTYQKSKLTFNTESPFVNYDDAILYSDGDVRRFNKLNYKKNAFVGTSGQPDEYIAGIEPTGDETGNDYWDFHSTPDEINNGDYFIVFVSNSKYTIYYDIDGDPNASPPSSGDTIGSSYIKVTAIGFQSDNNRLASITANELSSNIAGLTVSLDSVNLISVTGNNDVGQASLSSTSDFDNNDIGSRLATEDIVQGETTVGSDARVTLTGVVPKDLNTGYFYQVYRTAIITASVEVEIQETDPGDEMNLVYESGVTQEEIDLGEFEFTDSTPESFRKEALPLYINQISGEGVLQANEAPPIALDMELFRNYMFYANTKGRHKLEFTIVSIDDFISSSTKLVIGNSDISRYYTFVGERHIQDLTINDIPDPKDYFEMHSSNDDRRYHIYFGDNIDEPDLEGSVGYRIVIADLVQYLDYVGSPDPTPETYFLGDKVLYLGLNYTCIDDDEEQGITDIPPSGTATDNVNWKYVSKSEDVIAERIEEALFENLDFNLIISSNNIAVTYANNGSTTGIVSGLNVGSGFVISPPSSEGDGEQSDTSAGGDILLSGLESVAQAIDETARSIVKIITKDPDSPVNAYYLSTSDDLPGNIILEARSLEDNNFYLAIESGFPEYTVIEYKKGDKVTYEGIEYNYTYITPSTGVDPTNNTHWKKYILGGEFSPEIPVSKTITSLSGAISSIEINKDDHGYSSNDELFISINEVNYDPEVQYSINDTVEYLGDIYICISIPVIGTDPTNPEWSLQLPEISDKYTITKIDDNNFSIPVAVPAGITYIPTSSAIFSTDVESTNTEIVNRVYYSKKNEPEAVPTENFIDVGSRNSEIKRILALRDNLFVLKDDGIYIISGTSAPNWSSRLIDSTRIIAPDSAVILNNQIYCLTEQGVTRITGSGAAIISRGIEDVVDSITNRGFDFSPNVFGVAYENDRCFLLFVPEDSTDDYSVKAFRYNIFETTWSTWEYEATCGHVMKRDNTLYLGRGDINYISKERKNSDRTDHCDENFTTAINGNGVLEDKLEITSLIDVEKYDALVQKQEVSISYYNNRLLKKIDFLDDKLGLSGFVNYPSTSVANFYTEYPHNLKDGSVWRIIIDTVVNTRYDEEYTVTVVDDNNFTINFDSTSDIIDNAIFKDYYYKTFGAKAGDSMPVKMGELNYHIYLLDFYAFPQAVQNITNRIYSQTNLKTETESFIAELNNSDTITRVKRYKNPETVYFETFIEEIDTYRSQVTVHTPRPFVEGDIEVYKGFKCDVEWNPQHFGDPSALKQIRYVTIMFDQNNFYSATAKFSTDIGQSVVEVPFRSKGIAYFGDMNFDDPNAYWGGLGNDVPYRTAVPTSKQRCRYLTMGFEHNISRESFRILGVSGIVRAISDRGYR